MNTKEFFSCGGGSNLILGTGRKNQTIIFNICIIFEKKIRIENFLSEKEFVRKKLVGKTIFVRTKFVRKTFIGENFVGKIFVRKKTFWENNLCKKKIIGKTFCQKKKEKNSWIFCWTEFCLGLHFVSD